MLQQGDVIRDYEIESLLGRGGFGVVYLAKHRELEVSVAVKEYFPTELSVREGKTIHPTGSEYASAFQEGLDRFLKEGKQLERFRGCPNIVMCRDLFRANGTAYMVMEYILGASLSQLLQKRESGGNPFTERNLVSIMHPLLEGLRTVHDSEVYHRDIKPSNILVRREDGVPVLIDFGAAKQVTSLHTKSLAPYTDGYAAMEQIGEGHLGTWTDIYGVGAVMWRMVAGGSPPFSPPNPVTVQRRAFDLMQDKPDPLPLAQEIGKGRFADTILRAIDDCLRIKPQERIQTCTELIGRLDSGSSATVDVPVRVTESGKAASSKRKVIGLKNADSIHEVRRLKDNDGTTCMAFSPDSKLLAYGSRRGIILLDVATWHRVGRVPHERTVDSVAFSPDGKLFAYGSEKCVTLLDVATWHRVGRVSHGRTVDSVAFSPDSKLLASSHSRFWSSTTRLWDVATGHFKAEISHGGCVAFSPDGKLLASGRDGLFIATTQLLDVSTGLAKRQLLGGGHVVFSPDGKLLAFTELGFTDYGFDSFNTRLRDVSTGRVTAKLSHDDPANSVAFSPDGKLLAVSSFQTFWLWEVATGQVVGKFYNDLTDDVPAFKDTRVSVAFSPNGKFLAFHSYNSIVLWE